MTIISHAGYIQKAAVRYFLNHNAMIGKNYLLRAVVLLIRAVKNIDQILEKTCAICC